MLVSSKRKGVRALILNLQTIVSGNSYRPIVERVLDSRVPSGWGEDEVSACGKKRVDRHGNIARNTLDAYCETSTAPDRVIAARRSTIFQVSNPDDLLENVYPERAATVPSVSTNRPS